MFYSNNFQETTITINDEQYNMEYDVANLMPGSVRAFGNIYVIPDEPIEFTFFTISDRIAGYTPMNGTREFIGNIVSTVVGRDLLFEESV